MRFSKIKDNDIANGLGVTMSLWTQGCPHHCKGCFNGETWDFDAGEEFEDSDLEYILENINKNNGGKLDKLLLSGNSNLTDFSEIKNLSWSSKNGF